jgi:hypothetical protein
MEKARHLGAFAQFGAFVNAMGFSVQPVLLESAF